MSAAAELQRILGLSDEELLRVLDADPLEIVAGDLEHRPELSILLTLLEEARDRVSDESLRRWVRTSGRSGRPLDHLLARDFGRFEDAVQELVERGFVVRGGGAPG